ncbi:MAG: S-layer homology domain-containing protein, partial [Clostridia bacterium]|nr:S-layer homology domain-containing protein [Clostridia bacterium]
MKRFLTVILAAALFLLAIPVSAETFPDVGKDRWSAASIAYAVENGYMNGVGGKRFDPEGSLTRAMVVTVLWRRQGEPKPSAASGFTDVPDGEWYSSAVAWAKSAGIVNGISEKKFDPTGLITREQLAAMLFRFSTDLMPDDGKRADLSAFSDHAEISGWAREAFAWAVGAWLIKGMNGNRLAPGEGATREQFAAVIERFDAYADSAEPPLTVADFYVSPAGNDSWTGSFGRPFRTIGRAVLAVRGTEKTAERGGITVAVRAGEYVLFDTDLSAADSGTEECPIT